MNNLTTWIDVNRCYGVYLRVARLYRGWNNRTTP